MGIAGVVGAGTGIGPDGKPVIKVFTTRAGIPGLPVSLEGIPVEVEVTGMVMALTDPTDRFPRPVPTGVSTGHPDITAGTIGCRVTDGINVYVLSNNHVYANSNKANTGDSALQPGPYDGGTDPADKIGELFDFEPINFSGGNNTIDAAIAISSDNDVGCSTPLDDGYGTPDSTVAAPSPNQKVMKYGRTTKLTHGTIDAINVTVDVCYECAGPWCFNCKKLARFVGQIAITPGDFSAGGDSGSLIVTDDASKNPVGLLFAGSSSYTFANPIGPVLSRFHVTIDDCSSEPVTISDVAITAINSPDPVIQGDTVSVDVTVANVGNQDVTSDITLSLVSNLDGDIGTQTITGGLAAGTSTTLTFSWNTATVGDHTLTASHDFDDGDASYNSMSTTVTVTEPSAGVTVTSIDPNAMQAGTTEPIVTITGSGFVDGANVTFENGSGPTPTASTSSVSASSITATVTAKSGGPRRNRVWDVRVTNPDGSSGVLSDGFTVTP